MTLGVAFLAGLVSCLSPCVLPVIPVFAGYVTSGGAGAGSQGSAWRGLGFLFGFLGVFVLLWVSLGLIGFAIMQSVELLRQVAGALVVGMGVLMVAGMEPLGWLGRRLPSGRGGGPVLLGAGVAVGWTPCVGPTLGAILTLAASATTVALGGLLLTGYALGMAVPFMLFLVAYRHYHGLSAWLGRHHRALEVISGVTVIAVGLLVFSGAFSRLAGLFRLGF